MRSFIELCVKGQRRVIIDTSTIIGVLTAPNQKKGDLATAERPTTLIIRNADPIEVIGMEPVMILAQMCMVAEKMDEIREAKEAPAVVVQWLDLEDDG